MRILSAALICLMALWPRFGGTGEVISGPIAAQVVEVLDGDTLLVNATIWLGQKVVTKVRILGVDAPELKGRCPEETRLANQAKVFVETWLENRDVYLQAVQFGKYAGRVLAVVKTGTGETLSEAILERGLARPYKGGKRQSWCS